MKLKKELLLSFLLIVFSLGLVIASDMYQPVCKKECKLPVKNAPAIEGNPWNFLTEGVLRLAAV